MIPAAVADSGLNPDALAADDWRLHMAATGRAPTQTWAAGLIALRYVALRVPSFARTAAPGAQNLVLWRWDGANLRLNDRDGCLAVPQP